MFHGRADGVLNPSGVRFGSAEIYRVIEGQFSDEIADSICVGQRRPTDTDERVLLFLLMKPGAAFTASLVERVNRAIRSELSPRHVPLFTFETPEIPVRSLTSRPLPEAETRTDYVLAPPPDHGQPEKSGVAGETHCVGQDHSTFRHAAEPGQFSVLLSVCGG